jgi:hypothetical protein
VRSPIVCDGYGAAPDPGRHRSSKCNEKEQDAFTSVYIHADDVSVSAHPDIYVAYLKRLAGELAQLDAAHQSYKA